MARLFVENRVGDCEPERRYEFTAGMQLHLAPTRTHTARSQAHVGVHTR